MYHLLKHERHLPYVDTVLALSNMVLCAKSKGIDSCIVNLSEYHMGRSEEKRYLKRVINRVKLRLGFYKSMENNFEFYLRNSLKIPGHLKIMCGVCFGYVKKYPDINTAKHGRGKIMRKDVSYYILTNQ